MGRRAKAAARSCARRSRSRPSPARASRRAHPGAPDAAGPAAPAPRGGPRRGHGVRRAGERRLRRLARPALRARARSRPASSASTSGRPGAATLVLETVLPVLAAAPSASRVEVVGGTHVPLSPSYDYFARHWASAVGGLGLVVRAQMERAGFYPRGGGEIRARVEPWTRPRPPSTWRSAGRSSRSRGSRARRASRAERRDAPARRGAGAALGAPAASRREWQVIEVSADVARARSCSSRPSSRTGRGGLRPAWASGACSPEPWASARRGACCASWRTRKAAVDAQLADQLVVPSWLAGGGGGRVTTVEVTRHLESAAEVAGALRPPGHGVGPAGRTRGARGRPSCRWPLPRHEQEGEARGRLSQGPRRSGARGRSPRAAKGRARSAIIAPNRGSPAGDRVLSRHRARALAPGLLPREPERGRALPSRRPAGADRPPRRVPLPAADHRRLPRHAPARPRGLGGGPARPRACASTTPTRSFRTERWAFRGHMPGPSRDSRPWPESARGPPAGEREGPAPRSGRDRAR